MTRRFEANVDAWMANRKTHHWVSLDGEDYSCNDCDTSIGAEPCPGPGHVHRTGERIDPDHYVDHDDTDHRHTIDGEPARRDLAVERLAAACGFCGTYEEHTDECVESRNPSR